MSHVNRGHMAGAPFEQHGDESAGGRAQIESVGSPHPRGQIEVRERGFQLASTARVIPGHGPTNLRVFTPETTSYSPIDGQADTRGVMTRGERRRVNLLLDA